MSQHGSSSPFGDVVHDLLTATVARRPGETIRFLSAGESVTYRELWARSRRLAAELVAEGVRAGDVVGILSPNAPEFFESLFAVSAAGAAACPLPLPVSPRDAASYGQQVRRIAQAARMRLILASPRLGSLVSQLPELPIRSDRGSGCYSTANRDQTRVRVRVRVRVQPDDLAIVQFTSGSTAAPKGVCLTHRNVLAGLAAIRDGIALGDGDTGGFWLPLFHDMGLFGVMSGIAAGIPMYIWSPVSFIKDPARWLREFLAHGGTISAMPDFGYRMLTAAVSPGAAAALDMSGWRVAFNGSEPISRETVKAFTERFCPARFPEASLFGVYGMAEATLAVTFPPLGRAPVFERFGARAVAGVGRPVAGLELRITDPDTGAPIPDGTAGEIRIRGAAVTSGYLGQTAREAAASFADGWLRTGDLGYQRDGEVFVTGRLKEMIIVRGTNFYPQDVELIAREEAGVFRGNCAALADKDAEGILLIAETDRKGAAADELAARLRQRVTAGLGLAAVTVRLVAPRAIPRTSSGKVRRLATSEAARASR
jgi:acyl-CoA synthetase (AMP-forming)/AMP-acid ligase II